VKVKVTRRAEKRIEIVDRFWRENHLAAPNLFKEELSAAEERLTEEPYAGRACLIGNKQLRRLLLPHAEQWVYYVVRRKQELVVVQTVWGARRGRDPSF
jgi:plasmid stabilization system protein ParE